MRSRQRILLASPASRAYRRHFDKIMPYELLRPAASRISPHGHFRYAEHF